MTAPEAPSSPRLVGDESRHKETAPLWEESAVAPALLRGSVQTALRCLVLLAILAMVTTGLIRLRTVPPKAADPPVFRLDINQAGVQEWMLMPGIGPTMARRIIADRQSRGPFRSVEDLARVTGIGDKTIAQVRPYCRDR
ncbi:helix-hairpin-helix domain-containing protein [Roseiconus nitratireducens]|uniref:Helix-hairpin-helix domain-containing protein n=1 Tax=Roseiconus nitratireducens TaxID=2605748 RepID=A0A5M6DD79_9BACT|nr:helix-hairpin-helix domain-containing protein [Roseiconus nitratireducens]KAA5545527.1 helix-hairpin-helix domain-containing protein [Roseiconus nitratireducens]